MYVICVSFDIVMSNTYCALIFVLFILVLCLVHTMLPCCFSALSILDYLFGFSNVYLLYICYSPQSMSAWYRHYAFYFNHHTDLTQVVFYMLNYNIISVEITLFFSFLCCFQFCVCISLVSFVPNVAMTCSGLYSFDLFILVLCTHCCQFLCIVYILHYPFGLSNVLFSVNLLFPLVNTSMVQKRCTDNSCQFLCIVNSSLPLRFL